MKLITETNFDTRSSFILDEASGKKQWYIEGVFAQQETPNRNRRVYPSAVLENQIEKYNNEFVKANRALGELNHPTYLEPNPAFASHRITELVQNGNDHVGKALVLNTPQGNIISGLLEGGTVLGVSTRGAGSIRESKKYKGISEVQNDFILSTIDVVANPSGIDCFVNGIMEGAEWLWEGERLIQVSAEQAVKDINEGKFVKAFQNYILNIKKG